MNLYEYVTSMVPIRLDPMGLAGWDTLIAAGIGAAIGCGTSLVEGVLVHKKNCEIWIECACNGLGDAIYGAALDLFGESRTAVCFVSAVTAVGAFFCKRFLRQKFDCFDCEAPEAKSEPNGCDIMDAVMGSFLGCVGGIVHKGGGEEYERLIVAVRSFFANVFGIYCGPYENPSKLL